MTEKTIRDEFIENLAAIGVVVVGRSDDGHETTFELDLTDEQFAALDAELERIGVHDRMETLDALPIMSVPPESVALDDFVASIQPGHYFVNPGAVRDLLKRAHDEGAAINRRAGLNDDGEYPELRLNDVNAVNVVISAFDRNMTVTVDGRDRFFAGDIDRLIINAGGNRYVVLRDAEPVEAIPNDTSDLAPPVDPVDEETDELDELPVSGGTT